MTLGRFAIFGALIAAFASGATLLFLRSEDDPRPAVTAAPVQPHPPPIDAAQISTGQIALQRMPPEVNRALETYSDEIVKNAEAIATRQMRITGTCAPGSAIRIVEADGSVRCQQLPRGVVSVPAIIGVPRLAGTTTEAASVPGGAGRYQTGGDDDYLVVPIALPDGAIVTSLSYTYFDADPQIDTEAFLYRSDDQPLASAASSGAAEKARVATTERVELRKVDTAHYSYFIYFQVSTRAGAGIVPISASVAYHLP